MFEVLLFLLGFFIGVVIMNIFYTGYRAGTLVFHDSSSMYVELNTPVEEIYKHKRVVFNTSRR